MLSNEVNPAREQFCELKNYPKDTPITMLNILKFRGETTFGESGKEVYQRYFNNAIPFVKKAGGKLVWKADVTSVVIGDSEHTPDVVFLIEYPSVSAFMEMVSQPAYQKIAEDRSLALVFGGLVACQKSE